MFSLACEVVGLVNHYQTVYKKQALLLSQSIIQSAQFEEAYHAIDHYEGEGHIMVEGYLIVFDKTHEIIEIKPVD